MLTDKMYYLHQIYNLLKYEVHNGNIVLKFVNILECVQMTGNAAAIENAKLIMDTNVSYLPQCQKIRGETAEISKTYLHYYSHQILIYII